MVFEHIEKLKLEYTDKYVVVDENRPELGRFKGITGTVRTVNMSGRALVEFDAYDNTGWYDIDIDFLKVIDQPLPKPEAQPAKKAAAKPAAKKAAKAPSELEKARSAKPAAKTGGGMSVSDVLAAARGDKGQASGTTAKPASAKAKVDSKSMSVADVMAAARSKKGGATAAVPSAASEDGRKISLQQQLEAARQQKNDTGTAAPAAKSSTAQPAKLDVKKMSVAEMLAQARAEKSSGAPASATPAAEDPATESPVAVVEDQTAPASDPVENGEIQSMKNQITSGAEMLAYCRKVDGG